MAFHRRRLPHWYAEEEANFITWRLAGSLPYYLALEKASCSDGERFAAMDRILDRALLGPLHLRQPAIAQLVADALKYAETRLGYYTLHSFVVMPNHVHILITPHVGLPQLLGSVKKFTARRANQILGLKGAPFWQDESYDHRVQDGFEFVRIQNYIEYNPVKAGLCSAPELYRWSSRRPGSPLGEQGAVDRSGS